MTDKALLKRIHLQLEGLSRQVAGIAKFLRAERESTMSTLSDLAEAVQEDTDAKRAILTVFDSLLAQLSATNAANKNDAAMEALIDQIRANAHALTTAALANTPAAPSAPAAPVVPVTPPPTTPVVVPDPPPAPVAPVDPPPVVVPDPPPTAPETPTDPTAPVDNT